MTVAVSLSHPVITQNTALSFATKFQYRQWLQREVLANEHSVFGFSSDLERIQAIAESVREMGFVLRPKTSGRPPSSGKEKSRMLTPDEGKAVRRWQTFGASPTPLPTPRPKSANPKTVAFFTYFMSGFPKSLNMSVREQTPFFQELYDLLVQPMSQIQQSGEAYQKKHSWEEAIHLEVGCALLHGLQGAFGEGWDSDAKIKSAWASAYHTLIYSKAEARQSRPGHSRALSRTKFTSEKVWATKQTPFSPTSRGARMLGVPATALAAPPENKPTQTTSPTVTPPSQGPSIPSISSASTFELPPSVPKTQAVPDLSNPPPEESCCVIL